MKKRTMELIIATIVYFLGLGVGLCTYAIFEIYYMVYIGFGIITVMFFGLAILKPLYDKTMGDTHQNKEEKKERRYI